ncbi:hypothetical protein BC629DRAFT_192532 [Irpex lacteus]|nr:hypothetical protein BC629DRAFT_192532 [Irpex lacteus]
MHVVYVITLSLSVGMSAAYRCKHAYVELSFRQTSERARVFARQTLMFALHCFPSLSTWADRLPGSEKHSLAYGMIENFSFTWSVSSSNCGRYGFAGKLY